MAEAEKRSFGVLTGQDLPKEPTSTWGLFVADLVSESDAIPAAPDGFRLTWTKEQESTLADFCKSVRNGALAKSKVEKGKSKKANSESPTPLGKGRIEFTGGSESEQVKYRARISNALGTILLTRSGRWLAHRIATSQFSSIVFRVEPFLLGIDAASAHCSTVDLTTKKGRHLGQEAWIHVPPSSFDLSAWALRLNLTGKESLGEGETMTLKLTNIITTLKDVDDKSESLMKQDFDWSTFFTLTQNFAFSPFCGRVFHELLHLVYQKSLKGIPKALATHPATAERAAKFYSTPLLPPGFKKTPAYEKLKAEKLPQCTPDALKSVMADPSALIALHAMIEEMLVIEGLEGLSAADREVAAAIVKNADSALVEIKLSDGSVSVSLPCEATFMRELGLPSRGTHSMIWLAPSTVAKMRLPAAALKAPLGLPPTGGFVKLNQSYLKAPSAGAKP